MNSANRSLFACRSQLVLCCCAQAVPNPRRHRQPLQIGRHAESLPFGICRAHLYVTRLAVDIVGGYKPIVQISTDGFAAYPEAVDLAFGPYVKYGTIIKEYRNARQIYTPSEMVGTVRRGVRGIKGDDQRTINTSHVERLNGTQRVFLKRLNRLTLCFSKKLRNLEAAFAMFACYYNFCWQTRKPGKSGTKRPTAAMMAKLTGHVWSFDELFDAVLRG